MVEEGWGGDFYAFESRAKVGLLSNQGKKKKKENRLSRVWGENRVFGEFQIHCPHVFLEKRFLYRY